MNNLLTLPSLGALSACHLCARRCGANRLAGQTGFCRADALPRVALVSLHHWEEPCISGSHGSGTVFFSRCNLSCCYCQNHDISQTDRGKNITVDRLAEIFLEQQQRGAHNLNLVTPTPYVPQIIVALAQARSAGFNLPVVYNTSAYETVETVELLRDWVDVYLPDIKYHSDELAVHLSNAPGYFFHAMAAIRSMLDQVGAASFDSEGLIRRGVIVRHLALPGYTEDSRQVLAALRKHFGPDIWFSLMGQYTPPAGIAMDPKLQRQLASEEYDELIDFALSLGMENGFIQEEGCASGQFTPQFNLDGVTAEGGRT